jgi:hypothetical protein
LKPATQTPPQPSHNATPTHIETGTHDQCGDTTEKWQAPDDGCINIRNMLSIEVVKWNLITSDIKLVSYSSTIKVEIFSHYNTKDSQKTKYLLLHIFTFIYIYNLKILYLLFNMYFYLSYNNIIIL